VARAGRRVPRRGMQSEHVLQPADDDTQHRYFLAPEQGVDACSTGTQTSAAPGRGTTLSLLVRAAPATAPPSSAPRAVRVLSLRSIPTTDQAERLRHSVLGVELREDVHHERLRVCQRLVDGERGRKRNRRGERHNHEPDRPVRCHAHLERRVDGRRRRRRRTRACNGCLSMR
jgi:hypothetical protein